MTQPNLTGPELIEPQKLDSETAFEMSVAKENKMGAIQLATSNLEGFIGHAINTAEYGNKADFIKMQVPGLGRVVLTNSPEAMAFIIKAYDKTKVGQTASLEALVFGGNINNGKEAHGILTTTYASERSRTPFAKIQGADGVTARFGQHQLRKDELQQSINSRGKKVIDTLIQDPKAQMDQVITDLRVDYLSELFMSAKTPEEKAEFRVLWRHTESVFANLLKLVSIKALPGVTDANLLNIPILTKEIGRLRAESDAILMGEINGRLSMSKEDMPYDLLGEMMNTTVQELANSGKTLDGINEEERTQVLADLATNFYHVVFAALETTKSGMLFTHKAISENPQKQTELRNLVKKFVAGKGGDCRVDFADLLSKSEEVKGERVTLSPMLGELIEFAIENIVENIITPLTVRDVKEDIVLKNAAGETFKLEEGESIFIDIAKAAKLQLAEMKAKGEKVDNINAAVKLLIFGDGFSKCKGAHFAVYEIVNQLVQTLYYTEDFKMLSSKYQTSATNTLSDVKTKVRTAKEL